MSSNSETKVAQSEPVFVKAIIKRGLTKDDPQARQRLNAPVTTVIDDPADVSKLASYFPQAGTGKESPMPPGGWISFGTVEFIGRNKKTITVHLSAGLDEWTEGHGGWPLPADFEVYFLALLQSKEPK